MKAIEFKQQTCILAKDQPQYEPLPCHQVKADLDKSTPMTVCFELSDEEISHILASKRIWITELTFQSPFTPLRMSTISPFFVTMQDGSILNCNYPTTYMAICTKLMGEGYTMYNDGSLRKGGDVILFSRLDQYATMVDFQMGMLSAGIE